MTQHVLVVDDSAVVRQAFSALLGKDFTVDTASDPLIAMQKIAKKRPSVVVLDLQMPRMDGMTFLKRIMRTDPLPVVICSTAAAQGSDTAMRALEEGAVDIILKPQVGVRSFLEESTLLLTDTLMAAAEARPVRRTAAMPVVQRHSADVVLPSRPVSALPSVGGIIAIGASTGGTEALRTIIEALPPNAPGMVVVQHMPAGFTAAFARRLNTLAAVEVKEAVDGDAITPGRVLIAPGDRHLLVRRRGTGFFAQLLNGPMVSRHRPSVDVLFRSVAQAAGASAVGVLLTGMGDDGAAGLLEMFNTGASTIAQDEATSVVFGMPKEAIAFGAVSHVLPLPTICAAMLRLSSVRARR